MIQTSLATFQTQARAEETRPSLWGLDASQLHDAYWRSCGVQCIRRGQTHKLQPGADLFLLIEPEQLVLFDVHAMAERLAWRAAAVTRLRVVGQGEERYGEHVEIDGQSMVRKITRRYRPQTHATYRVLLTRRRRIARAWMLNDARRTLWKRIRRLAGSSNIDTWHCPGDCFTAGRAAEETRMLDKLVGIWKTPDRALRGIAQVADGVWAMNDERPRDGSIVIGPAWLGRGTADDQNLCVVGPTWIHDALSSSVAATGHRGAKLRDIEEIDPADSQPEDVHATRARPGYAFAKRTLDIMASGIGLLVLSPVLAAIALCILIEEGRPVLFAQRRQTRGGKVFRCWKFRTMCRNADQIKHQLAQQNVCDGPQFYIQDDPRVTKVGRVLRKCYLDELPQLWNVLVGQMSLVGPRPSPDSENQICPAWRELRLSVRPGLTGLWQLERTRRPGTDFQEWIRYDIEYIEKSGFWFDVELIARTLRAMVIGKRPSESEAEQDPASNDAV